MSLFVLPSKVTLASPPRHAPMFKCKGTNKWAEYKTKSDFFVFILERESFRRKSKVRISEQNTKQFADFCSKIGEIVGFIGLNCKFHYDYKEKFKEFLVVYWKCCNFANMNNALLWNTLTFILTQALFHGMLSLKWARDMRTLPIRNCQFFIW